MLASLRKAEEKFWAKVRKTRGCWLWTGYCDKDGYGRFYVKVGRKRKNLKAHRLSYMLANDVRLTPKLVVRHTCDIRTCVKPKHLITGTQTDNMRDKFARGREARGSRLNTPGGLTEKDIPVIRRLLARGLTCTAVGERFGVSRRAIANIDQGIFWTHVA